MKRLILAAHHVPRHWTLWPGAAPRSPACSPSSIIAGSPLLLGLS